MAGYGTVEYAEALEADALAYPDERGEILLESVSAWRRAGHPGRAREIADALVADGGDKGCFARVERMELSLDDGDWTSARAELAELARQPGLDQHHCLMAAELLVERDAPEEGLAWFDRAVARLSESDLATLTGPAAGFSAAMILVRQRRDLRERLGIPGDATDALAVPAPGLPDGFPGFEGLGRNPRVDDAWPRLRMLVFRRPERAEVRRRWPDEYDATDDEHYLGVELRLRELREDGAGDDPDRARDRGGTGRLRRADWRFPDRLGPEDQLQPHGARLEDDHLAAGAERALLVRFGPEVQEVLRTPRPSRDLTRRWRSSVSVSRTRSASVSPL